MCQLPQSRGHKATQHSIAQRSTCRQHRHVSLTHHIETRTSLRRTSGWPHNRPRTCRLHSPTQTIFNQSQHGSAHHIIPHHSSLLSLSVSLLPLVVVYTPTPSFLPSFHSPSYTFPDAYVYTPCSTPHTTNTHHIQARQVSADLNNPIEFSV